MHNIFQNSYEIILKNWYDLRKSLENADIETMSMAVDKWWQKAPLVNHHLHVSMINEWPNPWELIHDNYYCYIARGLGMYYTLVLLGVEDLEFGIGKDHNNEDVALVLVDRKKYILNYWPNTVETNKISDFAINSYISIDSLRKKVNIK